MTRAVMPRACFLRLDSIVIAGISDLRREPFLGHAGVLAWRFDGRTLRIARVPRGQL